MYISVDGIVGVELESFSLRTESSSVIYFNILNNWLRRNLNKLALSYCHSWRKLVYIIKNSCTLNEISSHIQRYSLGSSI